MMFSLYIACLIRLFGFGPVAQRGVAVVEPYTAMCDVPCHSWSVLTPTGGPIFTTSRDEAVSLVAILNDEYRRNRGDRRDFNGDGFVNSQDLFDFIAAMPQGTP